jgi:N utilization substance protein B
MQTLYTLASASGIENPIDNKQSSQILNDKLDRSLDLFITIILYIINIAEYAETDAAHRASKFLVTEEDRNINTKITNNEFIATLKQNKSLGERIKKSHLQNTLDQEWIKKTYQDLYKTDEYKIYTSTDFRNSEDEKKIIRFLWEKMMLSNENFMSAFTDEQNGWEDDGEMIEILMEGLFKNQAKYNFNSLISVEKFNYAHELLHSVKDKEAYLMELIQPKLKNWDSERVALIDILLIKMGICELLYFPTIPTKVTINEYIEIAKKYSTQQSAQFVNGVLDNIFKDLEKENKIIKQDRNSIS